MNRTTALVRNARQQTERPIRKRHDADTVEKNVAKPRERRDAAHGGSRRRKNERRRTHDRAPLPANSLERDDEPLSDMALSSPEGLEEERKLFYVALTRPCVSLNIYVPITYYHHPGSRDDTHGYVNNPGSSPQRSKHSASASKPPPASSPCLATPPREER